MHGRTLKLFLVDGTASGVITAEIGISSIKAVVSSRTALPDLIKREESSQTGIYILAGPDPSHITRELVYIGEGDQVKNRLISHDKDESKDFFTRALVVVSKDKNLTKAHGRYLESKLITAVRRAGRATLMNGTEPDFRGLPEPDVADMERVLDEIEILLPVLGFHILVPADTRSAEPRDHLNANKTSIVFEFSGEGFDAKAEESGSEFVVKAGSLVRIKETATCPASSRDVRKYAFENKVLEPQSDGLSWRLYQDQYFSSPSAAASFVYGGSANGRQYWKVIGSKTTYGEWRDQTLLKADATAAATVTATLD
jgi:hypothetical protein